MSTVYGPGLYEVVWKEGGSSVAAIYHDERGIGWLAPINWLHPGKLSRHWGEILHLNPLQTDVKPPKHGWGYKLLVHQNPDVVSATVTEHLQTPGWEPYGPPLVFNAFDPSSPTGVSVFYAQAIWFRPSTEVAK